MKSNNKIKLHGGNEVVITDTNTTITGNLNNATDQKTPLPNPDIPSVPFSNTSEKEEEGWFSNLKNKATKLFGGKKTKKYVRFRINKNGKQTKSKSKSCTKYGKLKIPTKTRKCKKKPGPKAN